jgi:hypothetical protein
LWWRNAAIDPLAAARTLWLETHPPPRAEPAANEAAVNAETNESSVKRQRSGRVHRSRKDIQAEKIGSQDLDQENRGQ